MSQTAHIAVAGQTIEVSRDIAHAAGYEVFHDGTTRQQIHDCGRFILIAMSEGRTGADAVLRAIALRHEHDGARDDREIGGRIADGLKQVGKGLTAEKLIARLPDRLRPYVETVYRS